VAVNSVHFKEFIYQIEASCLSISCLIVLIVLELVVSIQVDKRPGYYRYRLNVEVSAAELFFFAKCTF